MADFDGGAVEPLVGEVRVLRSFGLADDGSLLPITEAGGGQPWADGENVATCTRGGRHDTPDEGCACGFYAYGDPAWIDPDLYGWFRHVVGVVECYGKIIAGEKGVRAGKARIVAVWLSPEVPLLISDKARMRYPGVEFFSDRDEMERAYPVTALETYRRPPNRAMRLARSMMGWTPLVGAVAGMGLGFGVGEVGSPLLMWLTALLVPALWVIYLPVRWGIAQAPRALRTMEVLGLAFFTGAGLSSVAASVLSGRASASMVVLMISLTAMGAILLALRARLSSPSERDFEPVVRSGPLERLVSDGISDLRVVGPPHVFRSMWVHLLSSPRGDIALLQSLSEGVEPVEMLMPCILWMRDKGLRGALLVTSGPWVHVADQTLDRYVLSSPLPLGETFDALGVPSGIWCPTALRPRYVSETLAKKPSPVLESGVVPVTDVFPQDEMPMAGSTEATEAYAHAQALAGRTWYHEVQTEIARAGVEPVARPSLPPLVPDVDDHVLTVGWNRLLRLPWPDSVNIQWLYLNVLRELPTDALMQERADLPEQDIDQQRQMLHGGGWAPSLPLAGHLAAAMLDQEDIALPECFVRGDEIALIYPRPFGNHCRLTAWALPGASQQV